MMSILCHNTKPYCTCINWKDEDFDVEIDHLIQNFEFSHLKLEYTTLDTTNTVKLCQIGKCRKCGGQICVGSSQALHKPIEDGLHWLFHVSYLTLQRQDAPATVTFESFLEQFPELFQEAERPLVREWLRKPDVQAKLRASMN